MLLDLNLPVMDGYQVLQRMKADDRTKRIPVIVLTTTDDPREVTRCYDLGCNVYITKPVDYEHFCDGDPATRAVPLGRHPSGPGVSAMSKEHVRILLMEDDAGLAHLCRKALERAGYTVDVAADGEEGLAMYDAALHDVVALDHVDAGL